MGGKTREKLESVKDTQLLLEHCLFNNVGRDRGQEIVEEAEKRVKSSLVGRGSFPLSFYSMLPPCPMCGSMDVVRSGVRDNERKGDEQRYCCKDCGHYFSFGFDLNSHLPLWVWGCVLFNRMLGVKFGRLPLAVEREGKIRGQRISISKPTAYGIVRRANSILDEFEINARHYFIPKGKVISKEWQIDDRFHNWYKVEKKEKVILERRFKFGLDTLKIVETEKKKKKKRWNPWKYLHPTGVIEVEPRYCLAACVWKSRKLKAAFRALNFAHERVDYAPEVFKCDGQSSFVTAIRTLFPNTKIASIPKTQDVSVINTIETMWSIFNLYIPKKGLRGLETTNQAYNLTRHYYNFLRPHVRLGGKTPGEGAGIPFPNSVKRGGWIDLLDYAYRLNYFIRCKKKRIMRELLT